MPLHVSLPDPARRVRAGLSPVQVLACGALLLLADWSFRRAGDSFFPGAPLDETAHLLTALLLLQLLPARLRARLAGPALLASVAIDLDHLPQYLGYHFLSLGTPRPYSHSLLTPVVLLALALALPARRRLLAGLALGVILHFCRDLGEGNGSGVPLLWPLSAHGYSYPHAAYLAVTAALAGAYLSFGPISRPARAGIAPRALRRRSASRASA